MNDPGEPANDAGILVTHVGKGTYVYATAGVLPPTAGRRAGSGAALPQPAGSGHGLRCRARGQVRRQDVRVVWGALVLLTACSHARRTVLVVYSPLPNDQLQEYSQRFMQAHPAIDLRLDRMEAADILRRVRGEREDPAADVWFGGPADLFERAAQDGLLEPYTPTWAECRACGGRGLRPPLVRNLSDSRSHRLQQRRPDRGSGSRGLG